MKIGRSVFSAVSAHAALDTGIHGVGASTVCSEAEADAKIAAAVKKIATGTYTGDGEATRQIPVGFKCSMVFVANHTTPNAGKSYILIPNLTRDLAGGDQFTYIYLHALDGFMTAASYGNRNGDVYYYWAISE
ncbi:hypothetical protein ES708_16494 [subsurface metagenome]